MIWGGKSSHTALSWFYCIRHIVAECVQILRLLLVHKHVSSSKIQVSILINRYNPAFRFSGRRYFRCHGFVVVLRAENQLKYIPSKVLMFSVQVRVSWPHLTFVASRWLVWSCVVPETKHGAHNPKFCPPREGSTENGAKKCELQTTNSLTETCDSFLSSNRSAFPDQSKNHGRKKM